jgi:hypothetical protein
MAVMVVLEAEASSDVCNDGRGYDFHECGMGSLIVCAELLGFMNSEFRKYGFFQEGGIYFGVFVFRLLMKIYGILVFLRGIISFDELLA